MSTLFERMCAVSEPSTLTQMASMRRHILSRPTWRLWPSSKDHNDLHPDACFHAHSREVGFLRTRCIMRFVRTRVLQSKVRPLLRTRAICAVTSKPGALGTLPRWSLLVGRSSLISVGSNLPPLRPGSTVFRTLPFRLSSYLLSLTPRASSIT
jgi:hypothetical protein